MAETTLLVFGCVYYSVFTDSERLGMTSKYITKAKKIGDRAIVQAGWLFHTEVIGGHGKPHGLGAKEKLKRDKNYAY